MTSAVVVVVNFQSDGDKKNLRYVGTVGNDLSSLFYCIHFNDKAKGWMRRRKRGRRKTERVRERERHGYPT